MQAFIETISVAGGILLAIVAAIMVLMVILEDEQKQRYLVRAKDIQLIVVAPDGNAG